MCGLPIPAQLSDETLTCRTWILKYGNQLRFIIRLRRVECCCFSDTKGHQSCPFSELLFDNALGCVPLFYTATKYHMVALNSDSFGNFVW